MITLGTTFEMLPRPLGGSLGTIRFHRHFEKLGSFRRLQRLETFDRRLGYRVTPVNVMSVFSV